MLRIESYRTRIVCALAWMLGALLLSQAASAAITIAPNSLPDGVAGSPYVSVSFVASGGVAPYSFSLKAGALPPGMALSSAGSLFGAPTTPGSYTFTVAASDASSSIGDRAYTVVISAPVVTFTPATLADGKVGTVYPSVTFTGSGGNAPYTYSLESGALPPGMALSSSGSFFGTPTAAGTFTFRIRIFDRNGFGSSNNYSVTMSTPVIVIDSPAPGALPPATAYVPYSQTFTASGGTGAHRFFLASGSIPPGMALSSSGTFSGSPTTPGTYNFTLVPSDSSPAPGPFSGAPVAYSITVSAPTITLSPTSLDGASPGVAYSATFTASGGAAPYQFSLGSGAIPPGMALSSSGSFSGTPATAGSYTFTLVATDTHGFSATHTYTINVSNLELTPTSLPAAIAGVAYSQTLTASGGNGSYTFAIASGTLPAGLALSAAGSLTGTPTATGDSTFIVSVKDSAGAVGFQTYTLSVSARPDPSKDAQVRGLITSQSDAARRFAAGQLSNVHGRLERLHSAETRGVSNNLQLTHDAGVRPARTEAALTRLGASDTHTGLAAASATVPGDDPGNRESQGRTAQTPWGFWTAGAAHFGRRDGAEERAAFRFDTDGLTLGMDYRFSESLVLGASVGYAHDSSRIGDAGSESVADAYSFTVYGSLRPASNVFIDGVIGHGALSFDSKRYLAAAGDYANGSRDGDQLFASITGSLDHRSSRLHIAPYARVDFSRSTLDAFTESSGGALALRYEDQSVRSLTGSLGVAANYSYAISAGELAPRVRFELNHDFTGSSRANLNYADMEGGPAYTFAVDPIERNRVLLGIGADLRVGDRLTFGVDFENVIASGVTDQRVRLMMQSEF